MYDVGDDVKSFACSRVSFELHGLFLFASTSFLLDMTGARPEIINMVDWAGSGEVVGCWVHSGPCWLDGNEDKKMMSDMHQ